MARDTGTTMKPITLASAFRLDSGNTYAMHKFFANLCCTNVFSIRMCADIYRHIRTSVCGIIVTVF